MTGKRFEIIGLVILFLYIISIGTLEIDIIDGIDAPFLDFITIVISGVIPLIAYTLRKVKHVQLVLCLTIILLSIIHIVVCLVGISESFISMVQVLTCDLIIDIIFIKTVSNHRMFDILNNKYIQAILIIAYNIQKHPDISIDRLICSSVILIVSVLYLGCIIFVLAVRRKEKQDMEMLETSIGNTVYSPVTVHLTSRDLTSATSRDTGDTTSEYEGELRIKNLLTSISPICYLVIIQFIMGMYSIPNTTSIPEFIGTTILCIIFTTFYVFLGAYYHTSKRNGVMIELHQFNMLLLLAVSMISFSNIVTIVGCVILFTLLHQNTFLMLQSNGPLIISLALTLQYWAQVMGAILRLSMLNTSLAVMLLVITSFTRVFTECGLTISA